MDNHKELWYVVITTSVIDKLKLNSYSSSEQGKKYGFREHSYYTTIYQNETIIDRAWLYKVTDQKKLLLTVIEHGIEFYKTYEK